MHSYFIIFVSFLNANFCKKIKNFIYYLNFREECDFFLYLTKFPGHTLYLCVHYSYLSFLSGMAEPPVIQANSNRRSVSTLRPSAKDAYMLFQVQI